MWRGIVFVGVVMAVGDAARARRVAARAASIEGTGDLRYAQTMAFTTLMLFQLFNVFNARSDERSAFVAPVHQPLAVGRDRRRRSRSRSLVLYVPVLQQAFGTTR